MNKTTLCLTLLMVIGTVLATSPYSNDDPFFSNQEQSEGDPNDMQSAQTISDAVTSFFTSSLGANSGDERNLQALHLMHLFRTLTLGDALDSPADEDGGGCINS